MNPDQMPEELSFEEAMQFMNTGSLGGEEEIPNELTFEQAMQLMASGRLSAQPQPQTEQANRINTLGSSASVRPERSSMENLVKQRTAQEWGADQWPAMRALVMKESGFNPVAQNPTSTAFGMFQFLDSTWKGYGVPKTADPAMQTEAGIRYIKKRYGTPQKALEFHQRNNWY